MRQTLIAVFMAFTAGVAMGQSIEHKLYAVVFQATVDPSGKVSDLQVSKVMDPTTGTTNSVDVSMPRTYMAAVRFFLYKRTYSLNPHQFYTYTFFYPSQPSRSDTDPKLVTSAG